MDRALAALMAALVVHLQVVGSVCMCDSDGDGHHEGHAHVAQVHDDGDHDDCDSDVPSKSPTDPDHDGGPCRCDCPPAQPFMAPDAAQPDGRARMGGSAGIVESAPLFLFFRIADREPVSSKYPRPPPFVRGVSSASPMSLPKLQI